MTKYTYTVFHERGDAGYEKPQNGADGQQIEAESAAEALKQADGWPGWPIKYVNGAAIAENPEYKGTRFSDYWEALPTDERFADPNYGGSIDEALRQDWMLYGDDGSPRWNHVCGLMDDDIREDLHLAEDWESQRHFWAAYCERDPKLGEITHW